MYVWDGGISFHRWTFALVTSNRWRAGLTAETSFSYNVMYFDINIPCKCFVFEPHWQTACALRSWLFLLRRNTFEKTTVIVQFLIFNRHFSTTQLTSVKLLSGESESDLCCCSIISCTEEEELSVSKCQNLGFHYLSFVFTCCIYLIRI